MMSRKSIGAVKVNAAIILIAAFFYAALISPFSVMTASAAFGPIRRFRSGTALMIEVSWDASAMEGILDTLDERGERVTFAVSGAWAEQRPGMLAAMKRAGHEIVTMGYDPAKNFRGDELEKDIALSLEIIGRIAGEKPKLYFCGERDPSASAAAGRALGLVTIGHTVDLDCGRGNAFDIERRMDNVIVKGAVILAQPTPAFGDALPFLLEKIKKLGSSIVTIHKMLYN